MASETKPAHEITRYRVDSGTIKSCGYENGITVIEFHNGSIFAYSMEHREWEKFALAESKGRYFNEAIRGRFKGVKLTGLCSTCNAVAVIGAICPNCGTGVGRAVDKIHKESE